MLVNIIDNRENKYKTTVLAIFEPAAHDNHCGPNADQFPYPKIHWEYKEAPERITINEAIKIADKCNGPTTLYIYD